mgnify:CR=1 FL=1
MNFKLNQIEQILTSSIQEHGVNQIIKMVLNCLMKLERKYFLKENKHWKSNKANGYRTTFTYGTGKKIQLKVPRDRLGHFYPVILALLRDQEFEMQQIAFELYSKGLSVRDVRDIFKNIYGKNYSKSSISNMNQEFKDIVNDWRKRPLEKHYPVLIIDALHSKIRRVDSIENEATYTIIGLRDDKTRDILAIEHIPIESAGGWQEVFKQIKARGVSSTSLIIADGLTGLDNAIAKEFPMANFQKCVVHFKRNILRKVRAKHKTEITEDLRIVFDVTDKQYTYHKAKNNFKAFVKKWGKYYKSIKNMSTEIELSYYFTYLNYDYRVRNMLYTTNWVENLNKQFRRVLKIRNSMPTEESILLLIGKVAMDKVKKYLRYPIYNFKFDRKLFPNK